MEKIPVRFSIPNSVSFESLRLKRDKNGDISFDIGVLERILDANNIPRDYFFSQGEDAVVDFIWHWYRAHCQQGGKNDPVMDDLFAEVKIEAQAGQHFSLKPGRA